ncbi:hypothetical protein [Prosthecobacter sp. SYSU 5D2]|uniref:hypothetical protein n=1 Tax=Prosthecobacter sp. SYSU 5D2 TaxID=3134134 RepID=UPI0031FF4744
MCGIVHHRSKKEIDYELKLMREHHLEVIKSKDTALAFLVRAGLVTKSGRPTKPYRNG